MSDRDPALELVGVGKRFTKYEDLPVLLTSAKRLRAQHRRDKIWAVRGVDLRVAQGECFGIIGRNGSGKTTLMTLMAGTTAPTEGVVRVWGRVAPLIAVGVGFHMELTGRENILLNATILGMERQLIDQRFEEIIAFAEVEDFIDTPVKFYSSGMLVRLGFAVAVHVDPDVLLVDEVLAVGDIAFQGKCFQRMEEIRASGTTVVTVSHNLPTVRRLCERVMLLHNGVTVYDGDPGEAISRYHELLSMDEHAVDTEGGISVDPTVVRIVSFDLVDDRGQPLADFASGQPVVGRLRVVALQDVEDVVVGLTLETAEGVHLYGEMSAGLPLGSLSQGAEAVFTLSFPARLGTGSYALKAWLLRPDMRTLLGETRRKTFFVTGRRTVNGAVDMEATIARETPGALTTPSPTGLLR
jgi:ABC-type polysaccharide/polyol phosphate transport system ATPase subunit